MRQGCTRRSQHSPDQYSPHRINDRHRCRQRNTISDDGKSVSARAFEDEGITIVIVSSFSDEPGTVDELAAPDVCADARRYDRSEEISRRRWDGDGRVDHRRSMAKSISSTNHIKRAECRSASTRNAGIAE